jgi:hypothetical protein
LPSNRGRVFPLGQPDVIYGRQQRARVSLSLSLSLRRSVFGVSLWKRKKSVFGFRVSQSAPVRE